MLIHAHWHGVCPQTLHVVNIHSCIQPPCHPFWQASLWCQTACAHTHQPACAGHDVGRDFASMAEGYWRWPPSLCKSNMISFCLGGNGALHSTCQDNDCIIVVSDAAADAFVEP